jgi:hypothetical protein
MKTGINGNHKKANGNHDENLITSTHISSLWLSIAPSVFSPISYANASEYFLKLLENYLYIEQHSKENPELFKDNTIVKSNDLRDSEGALVSGLPVERGGRSKKGGGPHLEGESSAADPIDHSEGYKIKGIAIEYLCRILVASLMGSCWNGPDPDFLSMRYKYIYVTIYT